ncbi:hypothetical protein [Mycobacterium sp.]|jgi:uncharacterized protein YukE|uniref:hypothetical protein n=1 Tax=Mycobacterium sp. TaxID=1785 RepID=UPI003F9A7C77
MTISYHYGMGEELSHNMAVQAQMLHEHANDLLTAGNALVSEGFQGLGGNAYIESLNRLCNAVFDIADTITRHSGAVTASFHGANATDTAAGQSLSI